MQPVFELLVKYILTVFVITCLIIIAKSAIFLHCNHFHTSQSYLYRVFLRRNRMFVIFSGMISIFSFWFFTKNFDLIFMNTHTNLIAIFKTTVGLVSTIISSIFFMYFCLKIIFKKKKTVWKEYKNTQTM